MTLTEGKCIVFDDSFEHEAVNNSDQPRVVLIVDIWHPDLSDEEVRLMEYINNAQIRSAKRILEERKKSNISKADCVDATDDMDSRAQVANDFMSIIERSKGQTVAPELVWGEFDK